ncbi:MAG: InlB B-repeat-containing protein [Firmicutes bacterium]|nr:InlB B-repeat-containing protein [Bacillota bacterium]
MNEHMPTADQGSIWYQSKAKPTDARQTRAVKLSTMAICALAMICVPVLLIIAGMQDAGAAPFAPATIRLNANGGGISGWQGQFGPSVDHTFQADPSGIWTITLPNASDMNPPGGIAISQFQGWVVASSPTEVILPGGLFSTGGGGAGWGINMMAGPVELIALWHTPVNVIFHMHEGAPINTTRYGNPSTITYRIPNIVGTGHVVSATPAMQLTFGGRNFLGWYTQAVLGENVSFPQTITTTENFHARYGDAAFVTFMAAGGTMTGSGQDIVHGGGGSITRPLAVGFPIGSEPVITRTGYRLVRWQSSLDTQATIVFGTGNEAFVVKQDVTMTAIWERAVFTINFDAQGGIAGGTQTVLHGNAIVRPQDPTHTNQDLYFRHWATTVGGNTSFDFSTVITGENSAGTGNTLFAVWGAKLTLTLSIENPLSGDLTILTFRRPTGYQLTTLNSYLPVHPALQFMGWATSVGGLVVHNAGAVITLTGNTDLFARFRINPDYMPGGLNIVTLNFAGGLNPGNNLVTSWVIHSWDPSTLNLPSQMQMDEFAMLNSDFHGLEFQGWFANSNFTGSAFTTIPSAMVGGGEIQFFAKWTLVP